MKKFGKLMLILCLVAVLAVTVAACNEKGSENPGAGGGQTPEPTYTVTGVDNEDYALTADKTEAHAGDKITVTATVKNADIKITAVKANDTVCETESGAYVFTMPAENVTLSAETVALQEVLEDDFLSFDGFLPDTISVYANEFDYCDEINFDLAGIIQINDTERGVKISSSDQSVIPDSALSVWLSDKESGGGTGKDSGIIKIAVNDIAPGTTYITLTITDTSTSRSATIVKKLTVVAEGELEVPTMQVTVTFDLENVLGEIGEFTDEILIFLTDSDSIYGSNPTSAQQNYKISEIVDASEVSFTVNNFAVGHTYSVGIMYDGEYGKMFVKLNALIKGQVGEFDGNRLSLYVTEGPVTFGTIVGRVD